MANLSQYSWLVTSGLTIIIIPFGRKVWDLLKDISKKQDAVNDTTKQLAHDRIFEEGASYLHQGYVTYDELDNFERLCDGYFGMGGNGSGHRMYQLVMKLPNKEPDYKLPKYKRTIKDKEYGK